MAIPLASSLSFATRNELVVSFGSKRTKTSQGLVKVWEHAAAEQTTKLSVISRKNFCIDLFPIFEDLNTGLSKLRPNG